MLLTQLYPTGRRPVKSNLCGRLYGADTLLWNRVSRNICYAPGYTIMGGTTQILRNIMGERVLGLPREPRR